MIAKWKFDALKRWTLECAIGLATEDGASPNKKANKILGQDMRVCTPHDVARSVLIASGEDGTPCQNPDFKALTARTSKQSASFNRSVVANKALQQAQLDEKPELHESKTLTPKTKNKTRWLGLWEMYHRNRMIGSEMRIALTGQESGLCDETPAEADATFDSEDSNESSESEGETQEAANRVANKQFPLAHRCVSNEDFRDGEVAETLLDSPRETTLLAQAETEGFGEGLDIGYTWLTIRVCSHSQRCLALAASRHSHSGVLLTPEPPLCGV